MNALDKFAEKWEEYLNRDVVVKRRIEHVNSAIEEGRAVAEVDIKDRAVYTIELKGGKFHLRPGRGSKPLLSWVVPATLFREMLLGKEVFSALLKTEDYADWRCPQVADDSPRGLCPSPAGSPPSSANDIRHIAEIC